MGRTKLIVMGAVAALFVVGLFRGAIPPVIADVFRAGDPGARGGAAAAGGAESIARGRALFGTVGCALCHTPTQLTASASVAALGNEPVKLCSDLLLHRMGPDLADDVAQGSAGPDEFRTAPLWGLGQRIFFLHDGRMTDLTEAIRPERREPAVRPLGSERDGRRLPEARRAGQAAPAELPAVAVGPVEAPGPVSRRPGESPTASSRTSG